MVPSRPFAKIRHQRESLNCYLASLLEKMPVGEKFHHFYLNYIFTGLFGVYYLGMHSNFLMFFSSKVLLSTVGKMFYHFI